MKKFTVAVILSLLICTFLNFLNSAGEVENMTDKLIRIHIIANSDSEADQALKLTVRDGILGTVSELTDGCENKDEAMAAISEGLDELGTKAREIVDGNGFDYCVSCTLAREEFDERRYDGFTLPAGEYDSLCLRIGDAKGKNWWCVCYPSVCVGAAVSVDDCGVFTDGELVIIKEPERVRYKLWCFEFIRKLKKLFKS